MSRRELPVNGSGRFRRTNEDEKLGILSQAVVTSPDYKFVSEARVRSRRINDIVLVGEAAVHVKEIVKDGNLVHVATKTDFPARILCAGVVGYMESLDITLKLANLTFEQLVTQGYMTPYEWRAEPKQTLILTFDSSCPYFVLLSMTETSPGCYEFSSANIPLPVQVSAPSSSGFQCPATQLLGKHLAVDPYSRAIAIGAFSRNILVCETRSIASCKHIGDLLGRGNTVKLDGDMDIAKMTFLYPESNSHQTLFLLVLGYRGRKRHLTAVIYEWSRSGLWEPTVLGQPSELLPHHDFPTVLAPVAKTPGAFMVACSRNVGVYEGAHRGSLTQTILKPSTRRSDSAEVFYDYPCQNLASSTRAPLYKAWSRPHHQKNLREHLYLCREDGFVCQLEFNKDRSNRLSFNPSHAGCLGSSVDSAFANVELDTGDSWFAEGIVFCGDLCDGGVIGVGSMDQSDNYGDQKRPDFMNFEFKAPLFNWAPLNDVQKIPRNQTLSNGSGGLSNGGLVSSRPTSDSLWVTAGKELHGSLCELRYGCEMRQLQKLSLGEYAHATSLWLFERIADTGTLVLLTRPEHTVLLLDLFGENTTLEEISGEETLAACIMRRNSLLEMPVLVQVRVSAIEVYTFNDGAPRSMNSWEMRDIHLAATNARDQLVLLVTGNRLSLHQLTGLHNAPQLPEVCPALVLEQTPTSLCFIDQRARLKEEDVSDVGSPSFVGHLYIAVGLDDGRIAIFRLNAGNGLQPELLSAISDVSMGHEMCVCHSLSAVTPPHSSLGRCYLLCGLRNGHLKALSLQYALDGSVKLEEHALFQIGQSAVQVESQVADTAGYGDSSTALITCEGTGYHLQYDVPSISHPNISVIHITHSENRSLAPGRISILTQDPGMARHAEPPQKGRSNSVQIVEPHVPDTLAICGEELILGKLLTQPVATPRRIPMPGTPGQVIYSSHFRSLIVSSVLMKVRESRRFVWPAVFIVRPETWHGFRNCDHEGAAGADHITTLIEGAPGSKINCMLEWFYEETGKIYHFLVVGTTTTRSDGRLKGCLKFFKLVSEANGRVCAVLNKDCNYDNPVQSVCQFGNNTILCCSGQDIWKQDFIPNEKRLTRPKRVYKFSSRPCHISANGHFIFVSTERTSLSVFILEEDSLVDITSDKVARNGLSHLVLAESLTVMFSNKDRSLAGTRLSHSSGDLRNDSQFFEARLPISIKRLCQASVRPFCKRREVNGILEQDILGIATDGSLYAFDVLKEPLWRFLRFIQNMCTRHPAISPFSLSPPKVVEPKTEESTDFHVDGDVLQRLSHRYDAEQILRDMIDSPVTHSHHGKVLETPGGRRRRFLELLREALHECSQVCEPDMVEDCRRHLEGSLNEDAEAKAMCLVREVLKPPL